MVASHNTTHACAAHVGYGEEEARNAPLQQESDPVL